MTKLLNLDEVQDAVARAVKVKGVDYEIVPISVRDFIASNREMQAVATDKNAKPEDQLDDLMKVVAKAIPTMPKEVLDGLTFVQVGKLVDFIRDLNDMDAKAGDAKN